MNKKFIGIIAAVSLLAVNNAVPSAQPLADIFENSTITANASETDNGSCGENLTWMVSGNTLYISGSGDMDDFTYNPPWNKYSYDIRNVVLPDGLTSISGYAFYNFHSLTEIDIPDSVKSINTFAFENCQNLKSVKMPASLDYIESFAFASCMSLQDIELPSSLTSIGDKAFNWCFNLDSITIPASVTNLGRSVFYNCTALKEINVSEDNPNYSSIDGVLCNKEQTMLIQYPLGKNVTEYIIPESIRTIGESAFAFLDHESINIPETVTDIGEMAFENAKISNITIPNSITSISNGMFYNCESLKNITIPDSVTSIGDNAFNGCTFSNITIPDSVTSIKNGAFAFCESLTDITIPDSVTSFENGLFLFCKSLKNITIPNSVRSIGESAFSNCYSLESITFPDSVTSIGKSAFFDCKMLKSVTIPDSVTSIEQGLFQACTSLKSITLPKYVTNIDKDAFKNSAIENLILPDYVTSIGEYAFNMCTSLQSVTIPESVISIGKGCFLTATKNPVTVYYAGVRTQWNSINIEENNDNIHVIYERQNKVYPSEVSLALDGTLNVRIKFNTDFSENEGYMINGIPVSSSDNIVVYSTAAKNFMDDIVFQYKGWEVCRCNISDIITKYKSMNNTKDIASALEKYCEAAKAYFSNETVTDYSASYNKIINAIGSHNVDMGKDYYGSSLLLKSGTILRHYYTSNISGSTKKGNLYYIDEVVPAHFYSNKNKYCVNDYIYIVLKSNTTDAKLKNLCVALYNYGVEAENYS